MHITKVYIILFIFLSIERITAQENKSKYEILLTPGINFCALRNESINDYTYTGYIPSIVFGINIHSYNTSYFHIEFSGNYGKLHPLYINNTLYSYNYMKYKYISVLFQYFKETFSFSKNSKLYLGITYSPYYTVYSQYYSNILYSSATGYRKFYTKNIFNLSPSLSFKQNWEKCHFTINAYFNFFNYASYPDDNYIKQLEDAKSSTQYHWYTPKEYNMLNISLAFYRKLTKYSSLFTTLHFNNKTIQYKTDIRNQRIAFYFGISKQF